MAALPIFGLGVQIDRQPAHGGILLEAALRLKEFDTLKNAAKLILPTAASGEELFQDQRPAGNLVLIPCQSAEIIERAQDGCSQDAARAQSATGGNGGEQCQFDTASECLKLIFERRMESGEGEL